MSLADVTSARSSPTPENCPECDATASVTSDLHKYQVACTCKPGSAQYACADDPGPPPPAKTDTPPALPPRPPTSVLASNRRNNASVGCNADTSCRRRKYAWWCCGCGALAAALGGLLAAQHILVRAYTASPHHLETVPAAVPAAMLVLTGVCIMSLARRRNRYSYMIKVVGACCLMCALTCVLVTITTTVIHMNKLQTLKFCEYTKLTRTCTCFSMPPDTQHNAGDDEGVRCVFEGVSECGVVHGALYWCLRGVFALSVSAVLVCIFSCMLAYQLLSHERKKMYWEQLELRCRSLYRPPSGTASAATTGRPVQNACTCCTCHPTPPAWDISLQHRFWAPGRIGNLYSPNPGTGRKASAWSWFPWPRSTSQNSRCQMGGVPQSGDSAYGFCDETPSSNPQPYDDRYPQEFRQNFQGNFAPTANFTPNQINQAQSFPQGNFPQGNFAPGQGNFAQAQVNFAPGQGNFAPGQGNFGQYQEGFGESSGSFDAQTGVWGPPPPYSPQGRSGSRHHLHHQDPAAATLLHHHHIEVHRNSVHDHIDDHHDHQHGHNHHTCRSYLHHLPPNERIERTDARVIQSISGINPDLDSRMNQDGRINQDGRMNQDGRINQELGRMSQEHRLNSELRDARNQELSHNPDMSRMNLEMSRINPEISRLNPELSRINPELSRINPELSRVNPELGRMNQERLDMGHISQMYPEDMEMTHIQDGRFNTLRGHLVPYRCQRMDMSASNLHRDCRMDDGATIECLHQKSASKVSDQSSDSCLKQGKENLGFQNDKHSPNRSSMQDCRVVNQNAESEVYFADVSSCCNISLKAECCINPNVSLVGTIENHPESTSESDTGSFTLTRQQRPQPQVGSKRRPNKHKPEKIRQNIPQEKRQNNSLRLTEHQIEQLQRMNDRMDRNEVRMSDRIDSRDRLNDSIRERDRLNDSIRESRVDSRDRLSDSRNELDRMNDSRISDRMNETRLSERMSERVCDRMNESRLERMNDSRISERLNDSRLDRLNDSRAINDPRIERLNDSRISDRMNEARHCERMNDPRLNDSRISRINDSCDRMNDPRHERMNDSRISDRIERMSDLNSSIRIEGSPKIRTHISPLRVPLPRTSPKNLPKEHPRQSSSDSTKPDFFVPPPPIISPLSPNTEESLLSDDDRSQDTVYSNDPETSKCLGPDSQYEPVRDEKEEILKTNHHHCYSDTNTMDSGWQSGSEKQVTD